MDSCLFSGNYPITPTNGRWAASIFMSASNGRTARLYLLGGRTPLDRDITTMAVIFIVAGDGDGDDMSYCPTYRGRTYFLTGSGRRRCERERASVLEEAAGLRQIAARHL